MNFENAEYTDDTKKTIRVSINGKNTFVPADEQNRHYKEILRQNITIAEPS